MDSHDVLPLRGRTEPRERRAWWLGGGTAGNEQLTATVGVLLLVLLAIIGVTIVWMHQLIFVHLFVGLLLIGPIALKMSSTGYRFVRYYGRNEEYVRLGPPAPLMRFLVAPVLVLSTLTLFASGIALLAVPQRGTVFLLHKASFIVWAGAMTLHVLTYALRAGRNILSDFSARRSDGWIYRVALAALAIVAGTITAIATYPLADPWFHHVVR